MLRKNKVIKRSGKLGDFSPHQNSKRYNDPYRAVYTKTLPEISDAKKIKSGTEIANGLVAHWDDTSATASITHEDNNLNFIFSKVLNGKFHLDWSLNGLDLEHLHKQHILSLYVDTIKNGYGNPVKATFWARYLSHKGKEEEEAWLPVLSYQNQLVAGISLSEVRLDHNAVDLIRMEFWMEGNRAKSMSFINPILVVQDSLVL